MQTQLLTIYLLVITIVLELRIWYIVDSRQHSKIEMLKIDTETKKNIVANATLLTKIINAECMQCDTTEKKHVGSVILNRARIFNKTFCETIFEKNQFQGINNAQFTYTEETYNIVNNLLKLGPIDSTIIYFFRPEKEYNDWRNNIEIVKTLKFHTFAK